LYSGESYVIRLKRSKEEFRKIARFLLGFFFKFLFYSNKIESNPPIALSRNESGISGVQKAMNFDG
jgi:hypothetical protein